MYINVTNIVPTTTGQQKNVGLYLTLFSKAYITKIIYNDKLTSLCYFKFSQISLIGESIRLVITIW